ncbi:MAG: type II toxin-antitoxin system prevent-host-death family antitoxin [Calothrix sp. FI2-JRJ7]|jgi:prevent-host-death family protein|nr:type II toxin-antitoxin system prevent-host-death family antitoxin [Calothrix sp. FI2-JRJ7]
MINFSANEDLSKLVNRVRENKERIVIEQEGKATAAIITYDDLKRLETLEAIILKKAKLEELEWLKAALRNPAFDFLRDPEEDIYTLADGKPFHDPEFNRSVISNPDFNSVTDLEEDIYTIDDGKPFYDQG